MQYKDLNLKKIRDDNGLDFAHFTYQKGMCSCCYGPLDMAGRYWRGGKKPVEVQVDGFTHYEFDGKRVKHGDIQYLLFKNAYNGSGRVTRNDEIEDYTCIGWSFPMEKLEKVCKDLQAQLGGEYVVLMPPDEYSCILIMKVNSPYLGEKTKWHRMVDIKEV